MEKNLLRKNALKLRRGLSKEEIEGKSEKIRRLFLNFPPFKKAKMVLFYLSLAEEVQTYKMIEDALKMGKRVAVPTVSLKKNEIVPFEIKNPRCRLVQGPFNVPEPASCERYPVFLEEIDLVVVPGVAFDKKGGRIGFGGGFYDRLLVRFSEIKNEVKFVGLAFECQIVERVPREQHDVLVDFIITEKRVIFCKNNVEGGDYVS